MKCRNMRHFILALTVCQCSWLRVKPAHELAMSSTQVHTSNEPVINLEVSHFDSSLIYTLLPMLAAKTGESVPSRRLAWTFVARHRNKLQKLMCWLIPLFVTFQVSLHLYLNNPGGLVQAAVYEDGSGIRRKKKPLPNIPNNNANGGDDSKSVNMRQALGFCWSVSLTPGGKMAEKKVASLELNKRLKDLPCLSDVSSTIDTPDLQFAKTDPIKQTEEADENKG